MGTDSRPGINIDAARNLAVLQEQLCDGFSLSASRVGLALCTFFNRDGECHPSREALRKRAGVLRLDTVSKALKDLERAGFIKIRKGQRGNTYHLCETVSPSSRKSCETVSPSFRKTVSPSFPLHYEQINEQREPLLFSTTSPSETSTEEEKEKISARRQRAIARNREALKRSNHV